MEQMRLAAPSAWNGQARVRAPWAMPQAHNRCSISQLQSESIFGGLILYYNNGYNSMSSIGSPLSSLCPQGLTQLATQEQGTSKQRNVSINVYSTKIFNGKKDSLVPIVTKQFPIACDSVHSCRDSALDGIHSSPCASPLSSPIYLLPPPHSPLYFTHLGKIQGVVHLSLTE